MVDFSIPSKEQAETSQDKSKEKKTKLIPLETPHVVYCNSTLLQLSKEEAILSFVSGAAIAAQFAFSLPHLKRLQEILDTTISKYEDDNGVIDTHKKDVVEDSTAS